MIVLTYRHADDRLRRIDEDPGFNSGYSAAVVRAFRMRMQQIRAARNETDLYAIKSLHFEKLKGRRGHQRSIRLNDQFRLILEIEKGTPGRGNVLVIVGIEDYH